MNTAISAPGAPAAIGPYSHAVQAGQFTFTSGQLGLDPATGDFAAPDAAGQARQALTNLAAVLAAAGLGLGDVVKTTVFLADMADFAAVNAVYAEFFPAGVLPARSAVQVAALPKGARVEIEAVAAA
jgi:2-iminobutanoate/2-iminopropanoate deaminase